MAEQSLSEQLKSEIQSMQSSVEDLQSSARLSDLRDRVEDLGASVRGMDQRIAALRERGYAFESELEENAADFVRRWSRVEPGLKRKIETEADELERALRPLEGELARLVADPSPARVLQPKVNQYKTKVETLEGRVESAERSLRGEYDQFQSNVSKIEYHLGKLEWTLTEISEASFELLATESPIMAVKAVWIKGGEKQSKDDPEGVLYLTDQRIVFEQKEKITTKKVLFVATEKKKVQDTLWEVPVVLVEEVKARKEGFLNKDDYLDLHLTSGAPFNSLAVHIWQRGDEWVSLIQRAKAGDFDAARAIPIDEAVLEKVRNAPTKCPSCGGAVKQVILRGMNNFTCEYCGDVIRW
jgi:predicted  nucleic acid-binding Zn-ribbon protein